MKFLLAQINPVVGDLEGNAKKILNIASKASSISADLILFFLIFIILLRWLRAVNGK